MTWLPPAICFAPPWPEDPLPTRLQVYETPEVTVTFDPSRCIHSAECVRALPGVRLADHGPLLLRGPVRIIEADGQLLAEDSRVALCRCGQSGNAPFCDGSHARVRFNPSR